MVKLTFSKEHRKFIVLILCLSTFHSYSQTSIADTVSLTLPQTEERFLDSNFSLLAQRYNIDANRALVLQAKLWPNPNFSISHGLYSGALNQFFPVGMNDETTAQLSQLILLAGKRNKQIKIADANVKLAEYQFYDLIRTLKYSLRTDFFNIYYLQQSAKVYNEEITSLQKVVKAFNEQEGKGYIAEKEVVRIKAQLYSLQSEYNDLINQINDAQSNMRIDLRINQSYINPVADTTMISALNPTEYVLSTLLDSAYNNRTDLQIAKANTDISKLNYSYQKALAVPDLTLSVGYDEAGSFLTNFYSVGASIDLPFFNRNQGNIKNTKTLIKVNEFSQQNTAATVEENVYRSLQKAIDEDRLYKNIDPQFYSDFERLLQGVLSNYEKRNLSLLDFLDFYDSYKQNILQMNSIKYNRIQAFEDLNFYTGTNFFNER